jgi:MFS family permease
VGAVTSAFYTPFVIDRFGSARAASTSFALLSAGFFLLPFAPVLAVAVTVFMLMGSARGVAGVAVSGTMMTSVPRHLMGRVQNTFYFVGMTVQIVLSYLVGSLAHRVSLVTAFASVGLVYLIAAVLSFRPARTAELS